jgi:hypothetical protein
VRHTAPYIALSLSLPFHLFGVGCPCKPADTRHNIHIGKHLRDTVRGQSQMQPLIRETAAWRIQDGGARRRSKRILLHICSHCKLQKRNKGEHSKQHDKGERERRLQKKKNRRSRLKCFLSFAPTRNYRLNSHGPKTSWTTQLKPSGHYMYHQFNIHKFYVLPTQCIYVFCVDLRTKTAIISLYNINWLVFITETRCVYCAVRTGCVLYGSENKNSDYFPIQH